MPSSNEIAITFETLLAIFGAISCIAGGVSVIMKLFNPFKELKAIVNKQGDQIEDNASKIDEFDKVVKEVNEQNKIICKSLLVLLNHEITGNGIDKLKEQRDALEQYLINR